MIRKRHRGTPGKSTNAPPKGVNADGCSKIVVVNHPFIHHILLEAHLIQNSSILDLAIAYVVVSSTSRHSYKVLMMTPLSMSS